MSFLCVQTLLFALSIMIIDRGLTESPTLDPMLDSERTDVSKWVDAIMEYIENNSNYTIDKLERDFIYLVSQKLFSMFRNDIERNLIYQELIGCPFTRQCNYIYVRNPDRVTPCCIPCHCEFPECLEKSTCCLDIFLQNKNIKNITILVNGLVSTPTCVSTHLNENDVVNKRDSITDGAFMYASCPTGTHPDLHNNCSRDYRSELVSLRDITPVVNTWTGNWYRNIYCAYCHGQYNDELTSADIYLTCREKLPHYTERYIIDMALEGNMCDVQFMPKTITYSQCVVAISECNNSGHWLENNPEYRMACALHYSPILINQQYYRNVFCALCNDVNIDVFECDVVLITSISHTFSGILNLENHTAAKANNLDFESSQVALEHNMISGGNNCSKNQHYDYNLDICRDIICSPLMSLYSGKCWDIFNPLVTGIYTLYLKVRPKDALTLMDASYNVDVLLQYLEALLKFDHNYSGMCGINFVYQSKEDSDNNYTAIENRTLDFYKIRIQFSLLSIRDITASDVFRQFVPLHNSVHTIHIGTAAMPDNFNVTIELAELNPEPFDRHLDIRFNNVSDFHDLYYQNSLISLFPEFDLDVVRLNLVFLRCNEDSGRFEFNILQFNSCPKVIIKPTEYDWIQTDTGFVFLQGDFTVNSTDIYLDINGDLVICVGTFSKYLNQLVYSVQSPPSPSPLTIVSVTISLLSVVSLIFTLAVFLLLPRLKLYFPDYLNMSLVLVLLCAQCLYLVSSLGGIDAGSQLCIAVGMLLHLFWILSILWMNVCTYHMVNVITQKETFLQKFTFGRFIKYHVYAAVMALIPVLLNVYMSMTTSGLYGYGTTDCYISSQDMVLYTFGIPVLVIILSNIAMYFIMVYKIGSMSSVPSKLNDFLIFVKLSTVTGATWIFGFIYMWTHIIALSYLFILFNAGQGIFLMISLVLNRRVITILRTDVHSRTLTTTADNTQQTSKTTCTRTLTE